jgi:hypothetical protein
MFLFNMESSPLQTNTIAAAAGRRQVRTSPGFCILLKFAWQANSVGKSVHLFQPSSIGGVVRGLGPF